MGGIALRALIATARKGAEARPCERFVDGPVSKERMERVYRESTAIAAILSRDARSDALLVAKGSFHTDLLDARTKRKTRNDFAFVTRLRWAEQWIEIGLVSPNGDGSSEFLKAIAMIEEAERIFTGETSPGCAPPETELPPLARDENRDVSRRRSGS